MGVLWVQDGTEYKVFWTVLLFPLDYSFSCYKPYDINDSMEIVGQSLDGRGFMVSP